MLVENTYYTLTYTHYMMRFLRYDLDLRLGFLFDLKSKATSFYLFRCCARTLVNIARCKHHQLHCLIHKSSVNAICTEQQNLQKNRSLGRSFHYCILFSLYAIFNENNAIGNVAKCSRINVVNIQCDK